MDLLHLGSGRGAIELLAVQGLSDASSLPAAVTAAAEALLAHPLVYRDKVFFQAAARDYVGYVADMTALGDLFVTVRHDGRAVPVVAPLRPVVWEHDGQRESVTVGLVMGLKRQENAPDTRADRPPPKPAPTDRRQVWCLLGSFVVMAVLSFALDRWVSHPAAVATAAGVISGGLAGLVLQALEAASVGVPDVQSPATYWEVVRRLASRQIETSALPGEWTVIAIPAGLPPAWHGAWLLAAGIGGLVWALMMRWLPAA